jgi:hypothetical protein
LRARRGGRLRPRRGRWFDGAGCRSDRRFTLSRRQTPRAPTSRRVGLGQIATDILKIFRQSVGGLADVTQGAGGTTQLPSFAQRAPVAASSGGGVSFFSGPAGGGGRLGAPSRRASFSDARNAQHQKIAKIFRGAQTGPIRAPIVGVQQPFGEVRACLWIERIHDGSRRRIP